MKNDRVSSGDVASLCMELAMMLRSGLDVGEGLSLIQEGQAADPTLQRLAERVDSGEPLSAAMRDCGTIPDYVCALTACGERTGRTEEALAALAEHYESKRRMEEQLTTALLHPSLLMLLMLAVMVILLTRVLPVFREVYASLGGSFTGVAGGLLVLGGVLDGMMPILLVLLGAVLLFLAAFAGQEAFREKVTGWWNRRDRGVSRDLATARVAKALAMGLSSGLSMEESLELAESLQGDNCPAAKRCRTCKERLESGESLAESLRLSELLPVDCCRLLAAGTRAGTADSVMTELAGRLEERSGEQLEAAVGRVEPAMVLVCSVLVGVILLSVMLPLMNIMTAIG